MAVPTLRDIPDEWYVPGTSVLVYPQGDFTRPPFKAIVISNRAHLWNGLSIPYMLKLEGIEGYKYAAHSWLKFSNHRPPEGMNRFWEKKPKKEKKRGKVITPLD